MTRPLLPVAFATLVLLAACGGGGGGGSAADGNGAGAAAGQGGGTPAAAFTAFGPVQLATNTGPTSPVVARLAGGGSVVAWQAWAGPLLAQRVTAAGQPQGQPLALAASGSASVRPALAPLPDGGYLLAWADGPSGAQAVQLRRVDAAGQPVGSAATVAAGLQEVAALEAVALAGGGAALAWSATAAGGAAAQVAVQRYGASLQPLGAPLAVPRTPGVAQRQPRLAAQPGGALVLAWVQADPVDPAAGEQVRLQRIDAAGVAAPVRAVAATAQPVGYGYDLAALADGSLALVWQAFGVMQGEADLVLQRLDANAGALGGATPLPGTSGVSVFDPQVEPAGAAGFVVGWQQLQPATIRQVNATLWIQRFGAGGTATQPPQALHTYPHTTTTGQTSGRAALAGGTDGHLLLAWDDWLSGSRVQLLGR